MPPKSKPQAMVRLGAVLRHRREALGISQEEVARLSKLHRNYIGGVERAERNCTILSLAKLAEALGTTPSEVLREAGL